MTQATKTLSAADFFKQIQHNKLDVPTGMTFIGMVKKSEGREESFEFAPGGNCSRWLKIPIGMVESVEVLQEVPCKEHTHVLVRLNLKSPQTQEGKMLSALFDAMQPAAGVANRLKSPVGGPGKSVKVRRLGGGAGSIGGWRGPLDPGHHCHLECDPAVCYDQYGHEYWCTECYWVCVDIPE